MGEIHNSYFSSGSPTKVCRYKMSFYSLARKYSVQIASIGTPYSVNTPAIATIEPIFTYADAVDPAARFNTTPGADDDNKPWFRTACPAGATVSIGVSI
jgi:hypothetical protein